MDRLDWVLTQEHEFHASDVDTDWIDTLVKEWAAMLPDQAPLSFFVAQNTIQSLQNIDFHKACGEVTRIWGAKPYLSFLEYQNLFLTGAINRSNLEEGMLRFGCDFWDNRTSSRLAHGLALLLANTPKVAPASRDWYVANHLAETPDDRHLWAEVKRMVWPVSRNPVKEDASTPLIGLFRHDFGGLPNHDVRRALSSFSGMYLDRGSSSRSMPGREKGFTAFAFGLLSVTPQMEPWLAAAASEARLWLNQGRPSLEIVKELIHWQQPDPLYQSNIVRQTIFAHRGWASMFWRLEHHPEERASSSLPVHLLDYLAVQLILEKHRCLDAIPGAFGHARSWEKPGELRRFMGDRCPPAPIPVPDEAWDLFWALRHQRYHAARFAALDPKEMENLIALVVQFGRRDRLAVWQEAQEAAFRNQMFQALALNNKRKRGRNHTPKFQVMTCLDDREESFRRAIEETSPEAETFGGPGFFGLPIRFQALGQAESNASCPLHVAPVHHVREVPFGASHQSRLLRQQSLSRVMHRIEAASREGIGGPLLLGFLGLLAYPAMVVGLLFPLVGARFKKLASGFTGSRVRTEFEMAEGKDKDPNAAGAFSLKDQISRIAQLLENIGLTNHFAKVVVFLGHGSTSVNNPYKSAYDCGACAGNEGIANARIFAQLGNRPEVRSGLASRGIHIPNDTVFVGGLHDTCTDAITLCDLEDLSTQVAQRVSEVQKELLKAAKANALERCQRFHSAKLAVTSKEALRHVQGRGADLSQPRPEYGHCTNAMVVFGPRILTRGVFLDRRSFLISYEPDSDPDGAIIGRLLIGILPVLAGINLQYYFSRVDNDRLGAGTKLPHNPTAMVGVMEGASGDLRTGLPLQAVEIHNPMRLLVVVDSTPEILDSMLNNKGYFQDMVENAWVRLACLDRRTGKQFLRIPKVGFEEISLSLIAADNGGIHAS